MHSLLFLFRLVFALPVLPFMYWQGQQVWRRLPVPVGAQGDAFGACTGAGAPMNILLLGESTVAGVGVKYYEQTISAKLATELAQRLQQTICWHAIGQIGAKVGFARKNFLPQIDTSIHYDVIIILLGVNDTVQLTPPGIWQRELFKLIKTLQKIQPQALIYVGNLPPVTEFGVIPQPSRAFLGWHHQLLIRATQQILQNQPNIVVSQLRFKNLPAHYFSEDGVHPSEAGYAYWAGKIAAELAPFLVK
ncbi:MAG: SGNH/GDSL hydrolase family protein [Saprospiraceae bacterium]